MGILSFLTGVSSLFTGGDKTRTTTDGSESMTGEQAVVGDSTSTSNSTTNNRSVTDTKSTQKSYQRNDTWGQSNTNTKQNTVGESNTSKSGVQQNLSDETYAGLEGLLANSFASGATQQAQGSIQDRLAQITSRAGREFDVDAFVSGVSRAAASQTQMDLESRINTMLSDAGGSETGNSMAALLGNRVRNDAAATFAGVVSEATMAGEQMRTAQEESTTNQIGQLSGDISNSLTALLDASKGAISQYQDNENTKYNEEQNTSQSTHYKEGSVTTGTTTTNTKQDTKTVQNTKDTTKTTETGLTQVKSDKDTKSKTKTKEGDLFTNLVKNLTKTGKDATNTKSVAQKPKTTSSTAKTATKTNRVAKTAIERKKMTKQQLDEEDAWLRSQKSGANMGSFGR